MHYRYFGLSVLAGLLAFLGIQTSAACQEIRFSDGQSFCFDLQKLETDRFQAKISSLNVDTKELSCKLTLPNERSIELSGCEGEFQYAGDGGKISLKADLSQYRYELLATYDFNKGSFDSSSV